jgi:hypothetical protein
MIGQLLAFSRKQALNPEPLDLAYVASSTLDMLKRLLGEQVEVAFEFAPDASRAFADRGQVENALLNLVMLVASLAALALDTLTHAKPEARSLSGLRQALADPQRRLAEFCARWVERVQSDIGPATGELTRIARYWRRDGDAALKTMRDLDRRLALFSDGDHALATEGHQLRFADLVAGDVSSLVIQLPPGRERLTAPLVSALLAELVTACASASDLDHLGRGKNRDLLIVIEAKALTALAAGPGPAEPANAVWKKPLPLFDGSICGACERSVRFVVQAACLEDAAHAE